MDPLLSEICNKIPPGRIHPTAHSAQRKAKSPAPVYDPSFCLRDSAAPGEPALHLRHPVRDGDSRDFPPLPVPLRFKKFHRKYLVSGAYYARLENICQQEKAASICIVIGAATIKLHTLHFHSAVSENEISHPHTLKLLGREYSFYPLNILCREFNR